MAMPIEVLRVEQNTISKELARFRACDPETRSLYCREWAQYIHKKHFVWNAKTQEEVSEPSITAMTAGRFQINLYHDKHHNEESDYSDDEDLQQLKKDRSTLVAKRFEELLERYMDNNVGSSNSSSKESLIRQIVTDTYAWMFLPSAFSGLPNLFEPVEFNPYPDHIPLVDDPKDPSQILDPLIIERQSICLPSDCFHLLKNLTGDILLSHTTPTCHHTKPESKTPSDLEVERAIYNEHEATAVQKALSELKLALENTWQPLTDFLSKLDEIEHRRDTLMGKGCQGEVDRFFERQKYVSFVDVFAKELPNFKNKKSTAEELNKLDKLFDDHFDQLKNFVEQFLNDFVKDHLKKVLDLTTDLWKLIVPTIYKMGERMSQGVINNINTSNDPNSSSNNKIKESLKALDFDSLKQMESTKEVEAASQRVFNNIKGKVEDYLKEIDALAKLYRESSKPTLSSRIDRLNNKDFKKKIKRLESGYYTIRQTFRYEVTENIFPESLFCKFSLVCLEPLMQEGEVMEAVTIEKEVKRFMESHQQLMQQRCALLHEFEEGVQTGRRELAGILGKLFLKEGMRIQGDSVALKRQNSLLKSMGVLPADNSNESPTQSTSTSKKKAKKKKGASATNSGAVTPTEAPVSPIVAPNTTFKKATKATNSANEVKKDEIKAKQPTPVSTPAATSGKNKKAPVSKDEAKETSAANTASATSAKTDKKETGSKSPVITSAVKQEEKASTKTDSKEKARETVQKGTTAGSSSLSGKKEKVIESVKEDRQPTAAKKKKDVAAEKASRNVQPLAGKKKNDVVEEKMKNDVQPTTEKKKQKDVPVSESSENVQDSTTVRASVLNDNDRAIKKSITDANNDTSDAPVDFASLVADEQLKKVAAESNNQEDEEEGWATVTSKKKSNSTTPDWEKSPVPELKKSNTVAETSIIDAGWSTISTKKTASKANDINKSVTASKDTDGWGSPAPAATSANDGWNAGSIDASKKRDLGSKDTWDQVSSSSGWNNSDAKGKVEPLADSWDTTKTTTTTPVNDSSWGAVQKDSKNDSWSSSTPSAEKEKQGWGTSASDKSNTNDGWSNFNTATATPTTNKNTWGAPNSKAVNDGWGVASTSTRDNTKFSKKKSMADSSDDWRGKKNDSWSKNTSINDDNHRTAADKNANATKGWGASSTNTTTTSFGGWGAPVKSPAALSNGWGQPPKTTRPKDILAPSIEWNAGKLPWEQDPSKNSSQQSTEQQTPVSTFTAASKTSEAVRASKPVGEPPAQSMAPPSRASAAAAAAPPGILNPTKTSPNPLPPGLQPAQQQQEVQQQQPSTSSSSSMLPSTMPSSILPPQLSTSLLSLQQPQLPTGNSLFPQTAPNSLLNSSLMSSVSQLQEPLPSNLNELNADMLRIVVNKLHQENGTLLRTVYSLQQDLSTMTNRYSEIMALAREREAQTLALFESKKQTEMEETRRYVLSLEARIKQLEEQQKSSSSAFGGSGGNSNNGTTAGFGSQDLFAGYREEMSSSPTSSSATGHHHNSHNNYYHHNDSNSGQGHHNRHHSGRKLWQKNNAVIRCGNCGEVGHASTECKSYCRYCGSLEHLSETCPMN